MHVGGCHGGHHQIHLGGGGFNVNGVGDSKKLQGSERWSPPPSQTMTMPAPTSSGGTADSMKTQNK
jgi:hypothetical protein